MVGGSCPQDALGEYKVVKDAVVGFVDMVASTRLCNSLDLCRGFELKRHDIWSAAKILKDTRIPANGSRNTVFTVPSGTTRVTVRLLWRDVPASFAQIVLNQSGSSIPVQVLHQWKGNR